MVPLPWLDPAMPSDSRRINDMVHPRQLSKLGIELLEAMVQMPLSLLMMLVGQPPGTGV